MNFLVGNNKMILICRNCGWVEVVELTLECPICLERVE